VHGVRRRQRRFPGDGERDEPAQRVEGDDEREEPRFTSAVTVEEDEAAVEGVADEATDIGSRAIDALEARRHMDALAGGD
jgi:hypothetical protein